MTTFLNSAIVRIRAPNGTVVGTGFLVTGSHVLTCAHVVTGALGLPHRAPDPPQADLYLDFPLLAPESTLTARVSHWQPAIDVAVLELASDPPAESKPVRLVTADDLWGHSFRALGFPAGYEQGVWASGVLRGRQADGWLQIEDTTETGYLIAPGFSGGPVWDDVLGGVVGMIVAADTDARVKAAFLVPTDVLAETLPDLVHAYVEWAQAQLDADMYQLRARRDQADEARREMRERQRVVNLRPLDMTHTFKDRVREVQALCDHLTDSSVRLVSVVGRGGMGKTALVSRVLGDLEQGVLPGLGEKGAEKELPIDGILYLSAHSTGLGLERIYADVGRMLGDPIASKLSARWADGSMPLTAKIEYLLEAMQDGLYLILLDNLESVMAEDGAIEEGLRLFVERCLTQPTGVRLIVTSREQVKVTAAALRSARSIPLREGLPEDEAVALLRDLDPQGTLGLRDALEENLRRAARLTRGIPRALEILAGILHEDPTASLPRLLADESLFGEQVVEQLVAAGYSRLGETERRVMEALATFDRPVEETFVAYLLHPWWPGLDVRGRLHRLVRGYFVSVNRVTGRYSLHPLDRDYAYHQIPDLADEEPDPYNRRNLELRTADFYARLSKPESEWKSIEDLEPQLAEFEHRVRGEDYNTAYCILEQIDYDYLFIWGHYMRLLEMREELLGRLTDPRLRAHNIGKLGLAYYSMGQTRRAIGFYEEALIIACEIGNRQIEGVCLANIGNAYRVLGRPSKAIAFYERAFDITREVGDQQSEGAILGVLGNAYRDLGQVQRAIEFYELALNVACETGDSREEGRQLGRLGIAYYILGRIGQASKFFEEALGIARKIGDRRSKNAWLHRLGTLCYVTGQTEEAIKFYQQALDITCEIVDYRGQSHSLFGLARVLLSVGKLSDAHQRCAEALALEVPETDCKVAMTLGIICLHQRDLVASKVFADAVARCQTKLDKTSSSYELHYTLATSLLGHTVCDPHWTQESEHAALLAPALAEYRRALEITSAPGIVQDALRDLELIRAAGINGLEPAFELLEAALKVAQEEAPIGH